MVFTELEPAELPPSLFGNAAVAVTFLRYLGLRPLAPRA